MDEPTEGLAPVIVEQVAGTLKSLSGDAEIAVLLIEQNLGVAVDVADTVAVMVNGRVAQVLPSERLAADHALQQRLLGVSATGGSHHAEEAAPAPDPAGEPAQVFTIRRPSTADTPVETADPRLESSEGRVVRGFTRWNSGEAEGPRDVLVGGRAQDTSPPSIADAAERLAEAGKSARVVEFPVAASADRAAFVCGTFDTKGRELFFIRNCLEKLGVRTVTVDLSTSGQPSSANVHPREVARHHPRGEAAVFTGDRGTAVSEMAAAFTRYLQARRDVGGVISAGGSGGTALATAAMRELAVGVPKVMVSTVASGDIRPYVGPTDICMMYSVTDVSGINRISERVLSNAAHALAGMIVHARKPSEEASRKPIVALSMFGVTTPCVQAVAKQLEERWDCLVFHATGTGGQSMEKLIDSGMVSGIIDVTTTEICDEIVGGVLSAGPGRLDAMIRARVPYVGSCGALDMVNFWAMETVPEKFRNRRLHRHNANVTLMRTTPDECREIGRFIVEKLNRMNGPVRFLIPEGGVSLLDVPGQPFWDREADKALFDTIIQGFRPGSDRKLIRLPHALNDPAFSDALVAQFNEIARPGGSRAMMG
jgi:uncharacterized protein (UPF0261 family)/energy-coupling factor transporter ATP-binding protein EcfA2